MNANQSSGNVLVFGGTGAIGSAVVKRFEANGWTVTKVSRKVSDDSGLVTWDPASGEASEDIVRALKVRGPFNAVCWAQGANGNDSVYDVDLATHMDMYRANVLYIITSLGVLLRECLTTQPTRFAVISSIWQELSRQNKFSYGVTKAALHGLVLSAANDLGRDGHLFNAVLPGVLDTPMTRRNLAPEQIDGVLRGTQFCRLPSVEDVASAIYYLCSEQNTGVTGQFVKVDLGFSDVRFV